MVKTAASMASEASLGEVLENAHQGVDGDDCANLFSVVSNFLREETKNLDLPTDREALRELFYKFYQEGLKEKAEFDDSVGAEEKAIGALLFIKAFNVD